jgi:hypothetical protein
VTSVLVPAPSGPATIRLKPVVPPAPLAHAPGAGEIAPTVRVRPVIPGRPAGAPGAAPAAVPPASPAAAPAVAPAAVAPAQDAGAPKPGSAPLPIGPKPPKPEQVQAAKAKTSRISLDAALIGGQEDRGGPKTIRLKRPSDAPVGKITSHLGTAAAAAMSQAGSARPPASRLSASLVPPIPSEPAAPVVNRFTTSIDLSETDGQQAQIKRSGAFEMPEPPKPAISPRHTAQLPTAAAEDSSAITRRKTIRVKRPGAPSVTPGEGEAAEARPSDETAPTAHVATDTVPLAPSERVNPFFPVLAIVTIFILVALVVVLVAPDSKLFDLAAWPPDGPALSLPGMAPIPGRG